MKDFFQHRDETNTEKMRQIISNFPSFAMEFFVGIATRTSPLTRLNYAYDLRIFFDYLTKYRCKGVTIAEIALDDLKNLSAFDIEAYLEYLSSYTFDGKKSSCNDRAKERKLSSVRSFFRYFYKKEKLKENITAKVDMPKIHNKSIVRLEVDEVVRLLNQVEGGEMPTPQQRVYHDLTKIRDKAMLTLFLGTGMRISECVGLNQSDIDFTLNGLTVTRKGGDKTILYFSEEVANALREYIDWIQEQIVSKTKWGMKIANTQKTSNPLFFSVQGKRISVRAVQDLVEKYAKIISPLKKISPHKLRSTYGTSLYHETQDIYVVADVLGHKDVNTTKKHYAAMSDEIRRSAASKVKLRDDGN